MEAGELAFGLLFSQPDPALAELAGEGGMDFIRLDCEHGPISLESVEHIARASEAAGVDPFAKIAENRPETVLQFLDRGLAGLVFPHVNTAEEAREAVLNTKFPPEGRRGHSGRDGHVRWTVGVREADVHRFANRETMVMCLVEELEGLRNIEAIAAVPGVDVVLLGPGDLSMALGHHGHMDHPDVTEAVLSGFRRVRRSGKVTGVGMSGRAVKDPRVFYQYVDAGARMFHILFPSLLLGALEGIRALAKS
ncbi:MAG: siderophore biosynthesis protein SbnG [Chloroflexi bacterium]|nr:siderophore biosynthesis protein SbnG [Chloroflexota bacterium]